MSSENDVPPLKDLNSYEVLNFHIADVNYYMEEMKKMTLD